MPSTEGYRGMNYKQRYEGVKRVYLDQDTGNVSDIRITEHQIRFDSKSEFRFYLLLKHYFDSERFYIHIHPSLHIGCDVWEIDFSVKACENDYDAQVVLANIINSVHSTQYRVLREIFFEYKGFQDDGFLHHMNHVAVNAPLFGNTIVLVSSNSTAFGCWDSIRKKFYCHPIASTYIIEEILKRELGDSLL